MDRDIDGRYAGDRYDRERVLFEIEDYIGGNVEGVEPVDRMALTVFLRSKLDKVYNTALNEALVACKNIQDCYESQAALDRRNDSYFDMYDQRRQAAEDCCDAIREIVRSVR